MRLKHSNTHVTTKFTIVRNTAGVYVQAGDPCLLNFRRALIRDIGKVRKGYHHGLCALTLVIHVAKKTCKKVHSHSKGGGCVNLKKPITFDGSWAWVVVSSSSLRYFTDSSISIKLSYSRVVTKMPQIGFVGLVDPVSMKLGIEWEARMKTAYRRKMDPMSWQHNWVLGEFHSQFWICIACGFATYFSYTPLNGALSE